MRRIAMLTVVALLCLSAGIESRAAQSVGADTLKRLVRAVELAETDPNGALAALGTMLSRTSPRSAAYGLIMRERVNLLLQTDRLGDARTDLEALFADRDPDFSPALRLLFAQVLLYQDAPARAVAQLQLWRTHAEDPDPAGLFMLGYAHVQLERFAEATRVLEEALSRQVSVPRPQWLELLAYAYMRNGDSARAIELLEQVITRFPDSARWWQQLASNHLLLEELTRGTAALVVADLLEPSDLDDARRLARLHAAGGLPAEGADILGAAVASAGDVDFEDWMLLGEMRMLAREYEAAIEAFEAASRLEGDGEPQLMIGQLHVLREQHVEAREALRRAVADYGTDAVPPQAWYLLAIVEINLDDLDAAQSALGEIEGDPQYADRVRRLAASLEQMRR